MLERPFILIFGVICDNETGEVIAEVEKIKDQACPGLRRLLNWQASYNALADRLGELKAGEYLKSVLRRIWFDHKEFYNDLDISVNHFASRFAAKRTLGALAANPGSRDLTNTNKVFDILVKNTETGEVIQLDKRKTRLSHMRRRIFSWADYMKPYLDNLGRGYRLVMIGLTYKNVDDWRPNHIRDFMLSMRKAIGDKNIMGYARAAELQERGAVHYHLLMVVKQGTKIPMPDKAGLWIHGTTRVETARTVYYICTYVGKEYQKMGVFPKGIRMFEVWINPAIMKKDIFKWFYHLSVYPAWLANKLKETKELIGAKCWRRPGGGWLAGGKLLISPFQFVGFA